MPVASISFPFLFNTGRLAVLMGVPSAPTVCIFTILLFSITISTGPMAGAPVPFIKVTPRMMSCV